MGIPPGQLFYTPTLGEGTLCLSAKWDGQDGAATTFVVLSAPLSEDYDLQVLSIENFSGLCAVVEDATAVIDQSSAKGFGEIAAYSDGKSAYLKARGSGFPPHVYVRLDDGVLSSSPPPNALGFGRIEIVSGEDLDTKIWSHEAAKEET